jgi:hypothetical protein
VERPKAFKVGSELPQSGLLARRAEARARIALVEARTLPRLDAEGGESIVAPHRRT